MKAPQEKEGQEPESEVSVGIIGEDVVKGGKDGGAMLVDGKCAAGAKSKGPQASDAISVVAVEAGSCSKANGESGKGVFGELLGALGSGGEGGAAIPRAEVVGLVLDGDKDMDEDGDGDTAEGGGVKTAKRRLNERQCPQAWLDERDENGKPINYKKDWKRASREEQEAILQSYPPPKRSRTIPGALPPMQQPQQPQQQQRAPEAPQAAQHLADRQQPTQKCRGRQKGSKHFNERPAQTVATAAKAFRESVHSVLANVVSADSRSNVVEPRGAIGAHGNPFRSGFFVFAVSQDHPVGESGRPPSKSAALQDSQQSTPPEKPQIMCYLGEHGDVGLDMLKQAIEHLQRHPHDANSAPDRPCDTHIFRSLEEVRADGESKKNARRLSHGGAGDNPNKHLDAPASGGAPTGAPQLNEAGGYYS